MPAGSPTSEETFKRLLLSEKWDVAKAPAPRLRYAVFSLPRTGSELLCARLRLQGIGIPLEYFNTDVLAARLGCLDAHGGVDMMKYIERLEGVRTTPNGVFGTKLQPRPLMTMSGNDMAVALAHLRRFDKVVVLRRRDVVLQAISMARSHLTGQWHVLKGDETRKVAVDDARLFALIDRCRGWIESGERMLRSFERIADPERVRSLCYEELIGDGALDAVVAWISRGYAGESPEIGVTPDYDVPKKGDADEAESIRRRYLARS